MAGMLRSARRFAKRHIFAGSKGAHEQHTQRNVWTAIRRVASWKLAAGALAVFFCLALALGTIQAVFATLGTAQQVKQLLPDWASGNTEQLSDQDRHTLNELYAQQYAGQTDPVSCMQGTSGTTDPVLTHMQDTIDHGEDYDFAQAWILYTASSPEARSSVLYHHPDWRDPTSGEIPMTPEQIAASPNPVYDKAQLRVLWDEYAQETPHPEPFEFTGIVSPDNFAEVYAAQLPAVMWGLVDKGVVKDTGQLLDDLDQSCQRLEAAQEYRRQKDAASSVPQP